MPNITINDPFALAIILRVQKEYGELSISNFAMDITIENLNKELTELSNKCTQDQETIINQSKKIFELSEEVESLKTFIDVKRSNRFGGPNTKKNKVNKTAKDDFMDLTKISTDFLK